MLRDKHPDLGNGFFEVNLAPVIWKFVYRSEGECPFDCRATLAGVTDSGCMDRTVYLLLLSLLPLWPAVELLRSALDARRRVKPGNQLPGSDTVATNALVAAIVALTFAILATVQQFTRVIRLRGENCGVMHMNSTACPSRCMGECG